MSNPQEDADRIRLKRLAKLQSAAASTSTTPEPSAAAPPPPPPKITPKPSPPPPAKRPAAQPAAPPSLAPAKRTPAPQKLDLPAWENDTIRDVLKVTLDKGAAERTGHELIWLKPLAEELASEEPELPQPRRLDAEILDRVLIARLELDPQAMSDDLEFLPVLASLPPQTIFEYLVGCWKRINSARSALMKKNYPPSEVQQALGVLDKLRDLVISYAGLTLQEPEMFPQPSGRDLGPAELVAPLLSLTSLSAPLLSSSYPDASLSPSDVEPFLHDLVRRFEPDGELDGVLGPVVERLLFHEALFRPGGIGGGDASWRGVLGGLEALVAIKPVAAMITRMERWNPPGASASTFEKESLMGPLLRLGVFEREWPAIARSYYSEPEKRTRPDVESSFASLRGTLKTLQSTLFQVFNTIVRASPEAREAVLQYFARIVSLNVKRAGMQVEPDTVTSDSFMVNAQTILFRFAEPFMDAHYSKIDRIDPLYYAHSSRIDLKEETRINATSDEANQWAEQNRADGTPPPNFISDIFYLALAMNHYGYQRTIQWYDDLAKHIDDLQRHLDMLQGDTSWQGTPFQARAEAAITNVKNEMSKIHMQQLAYETQLADPELVFRSIGFVTFVSVWMIRFVDPKKKHPNPAVELPLPKEVPLSFRVLPEYLLEDIVDYYLYTVRHTPQSLDISGKNELVIFCLTFLTSTWYIKNPFLKAKINEVLFYGTLPFRGERTGVLGGTLNSHPVALKHLMSALMHFYIEVEQTGASSQFYDKFNARRNIAYILKAVWDNPIHRDALRNETNNVEKFVRFVNLMINDVTYLMDESLSELTQIHNIQVEMEDPSWQTKPLQTRREREATLRQLERHAIGYTTLGRSTVDMLRLFTAETKGPFMMPEIVGRLAAMLDYNLDVLVNRAADLQVKDKEKYKFNPRQLFSDILQVYLNLSDQGDFARAVAEDGRSYKKELFEKAMYIARHRSLKTPDEVEKLRMFVVKVEETKATIEAEEDLGDIPDEFLDPLMFTLMRDPVILPSSRTVIDRSTIKAHLLSDSKDPFNRQPLSIEDVVPDTALKARIDAFLAERKRKGTALDIPPEDIVNMNNETADAQMEGT
ncbi:hypothetical protein GLOTRDRAFT_139020 [Gloeophyllum trabeum ATCC 11539]|uniref:RING-type E3 ubiquitin transferase n=1 Tax=Gloeophyllum trabeum (strain ATCC 11539 / FP-39264 / Madison 617) TaxID=670483 RepID=S7RNS6_GLOTA|nr:uncharacterized protein GLOTRDRAFT_139020 [Gloeophyllum trabeum ATCC 11539]EPQ54429.1 hypothetical protein GLOTRDRAFT_139020 [Gloeophyllum trabeum ATCC 11539]